MNPIQTSGLAMLYALEENNHPLPYLMITAKIADFYRTALSNYTNNMNNSIFINSLNLLTPILTDSSIVALRKECKPQNLVKTSWVLLQKIIAS
jgi:hypothetical protein